MVGFGHMNVMHDLITPAVRAGEAAGQYRWAHGAGLVTVVLVMMVLRVVAAGGQSLVVRAHGVVKGRGWGGAGGRKGATYGESAVYR